jgi:hypothetical protein
MRTRRTNQRSRKKTASRQRSRKKTASRQRNRSEEPSGGEQVQSSVEKALTAYCDFVEKSAPQVKQALDDAYSLWIDVTKATVGLQETLLDKLGVDTEPIKDAVKLFNKTTSVAVESQRLATAAAAETSVKVAGMVRGAVTDKSQ